MKYCAVSKVRKVGGASGCEKPASLETSGQNNSTMRRANPPTVRILTIPPGRGVSLRDVHYGKDCQGCVGEVRTSMELAWYTSIEKA